MTTQDLIPVIAPELTYNEKCAALQAIGFFIGGLSDEGIDYYYSIHIEA